MILRPDGDGHLAIGQASHAWLSGQLARAWDPRPEPFEEVCLGALQHDVGMAEWDLDPARHPDTGLPVQFYELDRRTHLALWTAAPHKVLTQSRYAALLVSLHGTGLYERFPPKTDVPEIAAAVEAYMNGQRELQQALATELGVSDDELKRNQALIALWDGISLALCQARLPYETPSIRLDRAPGDHALESFTLDPWPFGADRDALEVRVEGRHLADPHADLSTAPVLTLRLGLVGT
ncbi:DUF3891 family protein [Baekduia sp. Peel2402]|uniref:DUF3891 family protein n=1 Tax=Baekduia sp. Peel2402 TaxID=3458296 RepID=UPI00403E5EB3